MAKKVKEPNNLRILLYLTMFTFVSTTILITIYLTNVESKVVGFHEECAEWKTIEKYELKKDNCLERCHCAMEPDLHCRKLLLLENGSIGNIDGYYCYATCDENDETNKPYLKFWNETICTKVTLIKEVE